MKLKDGLLVLRFNSKTRKWYKDGKVTKNTRAMTVYLLSNDVCPICGDRFFYCSGNKGRFCSLSCNTKYRNSIYGISDETAKKIGESNKGRHKNVPYDVQKRISEDRSRRFKGAGNPQWKGGITSENGKIYNSKEYKDWRTNVFTRDDFTCMICGKRGGKLEAHHIKRFSEYCNLRFDVNNGVTLCIECHRSIRGKEELYELYYNSNKKYNPNKTILFCK